MVVTHTYLLTVFSAGYRLSISVIKVNAIEKKSADIYMNKSLTIYYITDVIYSKYAKQI